MNKEEQFTHWMNCKRAIFELVFKEEARKFCNDGMEEWGWDEKQSALHLEILLTHLFKESHFSNDNEGE